MRRHELWVSQMKCLPSSLKPAPAVWQSAPPKCKGLAAAAACSAISSMQNCTVKHHERRTTRPKLRAWWHHQGGSSPQRCALWLEFTYCRAVSLLCSTADCIILFFIRLISTKTSHLSQTRRIRCLSAGPWDKGIHVTAASCVSDCHEVILSWMYLSYPIIHTVWLSVFSVCSSFPSAVRYRFASAGTPSYTDNTWNTE